MTKRRILGWMVVLLFIFGGAAACSDDDGDDGDDTEEDSGDSGSDSGGDSGGSGNDEVEAYCDAADELAAAIDDFDITDPSSGDAAELSSKAQELSTQAGELAGSGLDAEDGERLSECSQTVTDAAAGLAG